MALQKPLRSGAVRTRRIEQVVKVGSALLCFACGTIGRDLLDVPQGDAGQSGPALDGSLPSDNELDVDAEAPLDSMDGSLGSTHDAHHEAVGTHDEALTFGDGGAGPSDGSTPDASIHLAEAGWLDACAGQAWPSTPLAHLRLDETTGLVASDAIGSFPGNLIDMAPSWTSGALAGGLHMDGVDDVLRMGDLGLARSLSFWVQVDSYDVTTNQTGFRLPHATGRKNNQWSDPTLAYLIDDQHAHTLGLLAGSRQDWADFNLMVPSEVTGIEVQLDMTSSALNLVSSTTVRLSGDGGNSYGTDCTSSSLLSVSSTLYQCGSSSALWGDAWNAVKLSNTNFLVQISYNVVLGQLFLDYVRVNVHYASHTEGRGVVTLNASTHVAINGHDLALTGFPAGTTLYVDGQLGARLSPGFHHVAIASPTPISMSEVTFGRASTKPTFSGRFDDLRVYIEALTHMEVDTLFAYSACAP